MADDDGRLLLACIIGFGGGIYIFFKGFRTFRQFRVVADTPEIPIRSIPMGLVHVRGQARSEETLRSPVTHTPCYLFKVMLEERHHDSDGGYYWKHIATDFQSVKFYLEDKSGNVLVDATDAELDLPQVAQREVRSAGAGGLSSAGPPSRVTDAEVLQYIEQARIRQAGQLIGKGVALISHANDSSRPAARPAFLDFLMNPSESGAMAMQAQMIRVMLAKKDPGGQVIRGALELWKHAPGTPEFQADFATFTQNSVRVLKSMKGSLDPSTALAEAQKNPDQAIRMSALAAGCAEPQSDAELERARQAAIAYTQGHAPYGKHASSSATGHYRLTEYCLVAGQTYDLTGTCAENPRPLDQFDRNIILKGQSEPTFLISSRTQQQVESWLRRRSFYRVFGGAALAIVCLAYILWKAGLF